MNGRALIDRWFSVAMDPRRLALCRIATAYTLLSSRLVWISPRHLASIPSELAQPVGLDWPLFIATMPPDGLLDALSFLLKVALIAVLVGFETKRSSILAAAIGLLYLGVDASFGKVTCLMTPLYIMLLLGAFAPWGEALSLDAYLNRTPIVASHVQGAYCRLIHALISIFLFGAVVQKLRADAQGWLFGDQLRAYIFEVYDPRDPAPLSTALLLHPTLCRLFGIGSICFEGSLWISFFVRRLEVPYFVLGVLFHVGIYLVMGIEGWPIVAWYVVLVPWERWLDRLRVQHGTVEAPAS
jgi:hypothetical protein